MKYSLSPVDHIIVKGASELVCEHCECFAAFTNVTDRLTFCEEHVYCKPLYSNSLKETFIQFVEKRKVPVDGDPHIQGSDLGVIDTMGHGIEIIQALGTMYGEGMTLVLNIRGKGSGLHKTLMIMLMDFGGVKDVHLDSLGGFVAGYRSSKGWQ